MSHFHPGLLDALGVKITRLVTDSRLVGRGDTFVAYPGAQVDGRQFIAQAIAGGANAVIWEAKNFVWDESWQVPHLALAELRQQAGALADHVYGAPSRNLWMVGVTGTNGKTTCSHWIARALDAQGRKSALLGTLGNGFPAALQPTPNTTPEAITVHGLLADYVRQGARAAAMEVSSHALAQGRVNSVHYDVALLTNLSRDHLDYHGDMHSYAAAKRRLFDWAHLKCAVLNLDDAFGAELADALRDAGVEVVGYGLSESALQLAERLGIRMVFGRELRMNAQGMDMRIHSSWGGAELHSRLVGRFNAANLLGTLAVLLVSGIELHAAVNELAQQKAVPGRMQTLGGKDKPTVVVDYAHTPDALEKVLQALREVTAPGGGKIICVFGCGGDRDRGKRPMMGTVASRFADVCIVTSDNPRSESPKAIIDAILFGVEGDAYQVIEDRARAIGHAIAAARAADTVLVAGKGHEDYQEINGVKYPFSDSEVVRRALSVWAPVDPTREWGTT
ncbi:MAG: UDP-N-acetylmuramoyl-L-alanyl-D-glutamate--2,6-diaminopimelate ligase [Gallionellaceae bacterium]|nr:MAG: UDP-N-acetylmuramoyl-L-alanyl-D-glutamate--2,6-diaminopimelate ligase [Gallionellaceae bacterium]